MEIICKVCGIKDNSEEWVNGEAMLEEQLCQRCMFWHDTFEADKERKFVVIDGVHWVI